jgi:hypothetical protein
LSASAWRHASGNAPATPAYVSVSTRISFVLAAAVSLAAVFVSSPTAGKSLWPPPATLPTNSSRLAMPCETEGGCDQSVFAASCDEYRRGDRCNAEAISELTQHGHHQ